MLRDRMVSLGEHQLNEGLVGPLGNDRTQEPSCERS